MLFFLLKGLTDVDMDDPKIVYLEDALLIQEDMLPQLGIKVGILGHNRSDYDIVLSPYETEETEVTEEAITVSPFEIVETRRSVSLIKLAVSPTALAHAPSKSLSRIQQDRISLCRTGRTSKNKKIAAPRIRIRINQRLSSKRDRYVKT